MRTLSLTAGRVAANLSGLSPSPHHHLTPTPTPTPSTGAELPNPWDHVMAGMPPAPVIAAAAIGAVILGVVLGLIYRAIVPSKGFATPYHIRAEMSAGSARGKLAQTRPDLHARLNMVTRRRLPVSEYSYLIGRSTSPWMVVRGTPEDSAMVMGPPGQSKTVWMSNVIVDAPGPVIATSSKIGDHRKTIDLRAQVGPVGVFNPQLLGGVPSTIKINPVRGCEDESVASRRGGFLLYGARGKDASSNVDDYFTSNANEVLRVLLHAAALDRRTLVDVYLWVQDPTDSTALQILEHYQANPTWIEVLRSKQEVTDRTRDGIFSTLATKLSWLAAPEAQRIVSPAPGEEMDFEAFLRNRGTLYLVGEDRMGDSCSALFTLILSWLVEWAMDIASQHGRLDPWLTLALDEVATICPIPLPMWVNKVREHGLLPILGVQSKAQLDDAWGVAGGKAIWDAMAYTMVLRGVKSGDTLRELSDLCGEIDHEKVTQQQTAQGRIRTTHTELRPVLPGNRIRQLRKRRMLVIYTGLPPVIVRVKRPWKRRDLKRRARLAAAQPAPQAVMTRRQVTGEGL